MKQRRPATLPVQVRIPVVYKPIFQKKAKRLGMTLSSYLRHVLSESLPANKRV